MKKESTKNRIWLTALAAVSLGALFGSCKDEFDEVLGICPEVESTNPVTDAIGVQLTKTITVTFNEAMDPASIVPGAFSLRVINTSGGIAEEISGELTFQAETNSMNFKPSANLSPNTTYTGRVEPIVKDVMGNALQTAYVWTFTTGVSPTVIATDPANLATGVALDKTITATFSMKMDSLSISAASFTLMAGTTPVSGAISYAGNTASFKPANDLLPGTTYKGTISTEVKNKDGIPMATTYNWTFNTGTAPTVIAIDPKDLAISVPANKAIKVTFSELMNAATINASAFTVKIGSVAVAGTVTYSDSSAVFTPIISLLSNTTYSVTISKLVKNPAGIPMANDFVSTFTTGNFAIPKVASTDPANNATGVAINKVIKTTFSEAMNPATISGSTFTVKQGTTNVPGTVTYSGTTATFTPTNPLSSNLVYTGTITTGAKNTAGTAMANNFVWTFTTAAIVAPTVSSTDPGNNATSVALNKVVKATFSEAMNPATISGGTFTIKQGTTNVAGTVTYSGSTATFTPTNPFSPSLVYTGTITTDAKNAAGTGLANNFVWSFTTAALNVPTVNSTDPANNATGVAMNKAIKAVFNEAMNPATITGSTFTLKQGNTAVAGTVTYAGTTATFTPTNPLSPNLVYTGTITTGAKNGAGTAIASNYVWSFTTVASIAPMVVSIDPANNATGVPINKLIKATFSEAMNPATITGTTFTVKQGGNAVSGIVSYNGTTATFTPNNPLASNLVYTVTITIGAKNVDGTPLASNFVSTFTTSANVSPTVVSTDPANNATNVALNKVVKATFSEAMNPATITGATFTVKQGQTAVAGTVTYSGTTASFTPTNPFSGGLVYTGTITTEAKNAAGTGLANNFVWTFTTAANVAPTVVSTDPANNATNVALNKVVNATFSEAMNPATITGATFTLKQGQTAIAGNVSYNGTTASFTPNVPLLPNLVYTGTITTEAKNSAGTGLANNYVWTFTTVAPIVPTVLSTDPMNNATNVARNKVVRATFSIPMDATSINGNTFKLQLNGANVAGMVSYSGTTASFTPTSLLSANQVYTATITTGAQSIAGSNLVNDYVWSFRIENPTSAYFVDLKTAGRFGIFAATGISNNAGFSEIRNLDVGISPGARSSVTGFPPAIVVNGAIYASDDASPAGVAAMLIQAKSDLLQAYLFAEGASSPAPATMAGDQGGKTLAPGIYKSNSTLLIQAGDLTLDAQGDPNAVWIFQIASGFTTVGGSGGNVILTGGAQAKNIFWQVGSSATIGDNTNFKGNVLAFTSITMNSGAKITGRMLVLNGAVVMTNTNIIEKP
ncbi:Ig-like domain-containing protein [Rhodonellum sp.]|uniref:Ig-like domain-containing protein n=1 Tax=Rhodonellum sp. TaxID=2231180 RepID=UPI0027185D62|nr:Ig-like domain-containing protein [Rhodonellum sp.]MDO9554485.1 Ig-like domain-containing protein [Rhodonellum sp.]